RNTDNNVETDLHASYKPSAKMPRARVPFIITYIYNHPITSKTANGGHIKKLDINANLEDKSELSSLSPHSETVIKSSTHKLMAKASQ
ncbi:hypothetical protein HPG69_018537, partial [Diceros bicornis minor]